MITKNNESENWAALSAISENWAALSCSGLVTVTNRTINDGYGTQWGLDSN
jgi:hypothetical protein